jgi:hypothetical protein
VTDHLQDPGNPGLHFVLAAVEEVFALEKLNGRRDLSKMNVR